jgi:hypothetical protein
MSFAVARRHAAAALLVLALAACDSSGPATPSPTANPPVSADQSSAGPSAGAGAPSIGSTGASSTSSPSPSASPSATGAGGTPRPGASVEGVQLVKTGGIAGVNETIEVKPDGVWHHIDGKRDTTRSGKLTAAQMAELQRLLTDPKLLAEGGKVGTGHCSDAFEYLLIVKYRLIHYTACGQGTKPEITLKIIELLQSATKAQ